MKKLNWGLIGCGDIAERRVAPALRDLSNSELVAVNRHDYTRAETFAKKFGARKWYERWQDLITDEDIERRTSYAVKIGAATDGAFPLPMGLNNKT